MNPLRQQALPWPCSSLHWLPCQSQVLCSPCSTWAAQAHPLNGDVVDPLPLLLLVEALGIDAVHPLCEKSLLPLDGCTLLGTAALSAHCDDQSFTK